MSEPASAQESIELYLEACRVKGAEAGLLGKRLALVRFVGRLREQGILDLRQAREQDVVSFLDWLSSQRGRGGASLARATVESALQQVRGLYAFLARRGLALSNPAAGVRLAREERLPRGVLSEAQARRLVESPSPRTPVGLRDRALLELLYGSGLRAGECVRLELFDLDLCGGTLLVRDGKGRKDRVTPLSGQAVLALEAYLRRGRPRLSGRLRESGVFVSAITGRRLTRSGLQQVVVAHGRRVGIPRPLHPHALRHTCATHLLRGGADVRQVQRILGHRSLRSTMLYTRVETSDLRRVLERSHPRERRRRRRR